MRVGVTSFAFRHRIQAHGLTPAGFLEMAADAGAEVVQPCENLLPCGTPEARLRDFGSAARSLGLALELGASCASDDDLDAAVRMAEACEAGCLRVVLGPRPAADWVAALRRAAGAAAAAGIAVAVENHFDMGPAEMARLIRAAGKGVGACLDPLNAIVGLAGPAETIQQLGPLAVTGHAKDAVVLRRGVGFSIQGCPIGAGRAPIHELLDALADAGARSVHVEGWMEPLDTEAATLARERSWARDGIAFLKAAMARGGKNR